jgi:hypothetical protein
MSSIKAPTIIIILIANQRINPNYALSPSLGGEAGAEEAIPAIRRMGIPEVLALSLGMGLSRTVELRDQTVEGCHPRQDKGKSQLRSQRHVIKRIFERWGGVPARTTDVTNRRGESVNLRLFAVLAVL